MNVRIQSVKFDADKKLVQFAENKLSKLERFIEDAVSVEVTMSLDKDNERGNKVVTIRVAIPGNDLISESRNATFEEGIDSCIDALKKQNEKRKDK